jgi:hypothetical protein
MIDLPNLPQPPTDNLYKFKAIGGISLLMLCVIIPAFWTYSNITNVMDSTAKIDVLEEEQNNLLEDSARSITEITEGKVESEEKKEEFRKRFREMKLRIIEAKSENRKERVNSIGLLIAIIIFTFLSINSWFWIYRGFNDWQNKLQNYQDEIVKNQAKENAKDDSDKSLIIKPNE